MLSNSIIASHCCGSVAVFHNSLAPERRSSVKDEIQPRSCESYYRTRTVANGNSYLWITVWCPSILSFCHCLAHALLTLSFNSSPSQFSEIALFISTSNQHNNENKSAKHCPPHLIDRLISRLLEINWAAPYMLQPPRNSLFPTFSV